MRNRIFAALICALLTGSAGLAETPGDGKIHVVPTDPDFDAEQFRDAKDPKIQVHQYGKEDHSLGLPPEREIRRILREAGLENHGLDAVDRDRLIIRAQHFDPSRLQELYPKFAKASLAKLSKLAKAAKPKKDVP